MNNKINDNFRVWVKQMDCEEDSFEVDLKPGSNINDLKKVIKTALANDFQIEISSVKFVCSRDDPLSKIGPGNIVIYGAGEIGSTPELPYYYCCSQRQVRTEEPLTPNTKVNMEKLGVREDASLSETLSVVFSRVTLLSSEVQKLRDENDEQKAANLLCTNSESMVGRELIQRLSQQDTRVTKWVLGTPESSVERVDVKAVMFKPNAKFKEGEDKNVNAPMFALLQSNVMTSGKLVLPVNHSKLVDLRGREQRADLTWYNGPFEEWLLVIGQLEGKNDLTDKAQLEIVLGQASLRSGAILDMQPGRQFVVIIIYDPKQVIFVKRWRDPLRFEITESMPLFSFDVKGKFAEVKEGFLHTLDFLNNPADMGFVQCPVRLVQEGPVIRTLCARVSERGGGPRAVFAQQDGVICKAAQAGGIIQREFDFLVHMHQNQVSGIPHLLCAEVQKVQVQITKVNSNTIHEEWDSFTSQPHCSALVPSMVMATHFRQFAEILEAAAEVGVINNDISCDNLLLDFTGAAAATAEVAQKFALYEADCASDLSPHQLTKEDRQRRVLLRTEWQEKCAAAKLWSSGRAHIADWGNASSPGEDVGYSGKMLFLPMSCIDKAGNMIPRKASLLHDLESLLMVAVVCSDGDVRWASSMGPRRYTDRIRECGMDGKFLKVFKWPFVQKLASILSPTNHRLSDADKIDRAMKVFKEIKI